MRLIGHSSISSFLTGLLTAASVIVGLAMVISAGLAVMSIFADVPGGEIDFPVSFHVDSQALHVTAPELGVSTAELRNVNGSLKFRPPATTSLVPAALGGLSLILGVILWALGELRAIFRTLHDGQPFVSVNATRIRSIGVVVIVGEVGRALLFFLTSSYARRYFTADGLRFDADLHVNFLAVIAGLIILVIAEVFRAGTRLAEDQSLTI